MVPKCGVHTLATATRVSYSLSLSLSLSLSHTHTHTNEHTHTHTGVAECPFSFYKTWVENPLLAQAQVEAMTRKVNPNSKLNPTSKLNHLPRRSLKP
jgi:hypothetical protein